MKLHRYTVRAIQNDAKHLLVSSSFIVPLFFQIGAKSQADEIFRFSGLHNKSLLDFKDETVYLN